MEYCLYTGGQVIGVQGNVAEFPGLGKGKFTGTSITLTQSSFIANVSWV